VGLSEEVLRIGTVLGRGVRLERRGVRQKTFYEAGDSGRQGTA